MTVKAILSKKGANVVTMQPTATVAEAVKMLADRRIGAVVITDNKEVAGILSERDIVRVLALRGPRALEESVGEVMTRKVETCTESCTVCDIMERMTRGKFRHVPVLESGKIVGIISIGDVVKHRLEEVQHESNALREYILTA